MNIYSGLLSPGCLHNGVAGMGIISEINADILAAEYIRI